MAGFPTSIYARIYGFFEGLVIRQRRTAVTVVHLLQVIAANYAAFLIRFEGKIPHGEMQIFVHYLPYLIVIRLVFYLQAGLHKDLWRYSSINDLISIFKSVTIGSLVFFFAVRTFVGDISYPRSIYVIDWLMMIIISGGTRFVIRIFKEYIKTDYAGKRVLIIGAGDAGEMIVRDMKNNPRYSYDPIGFIDDDPYKKGLSIHGVPIFGSTKSLNDAVVKHEPEEILICMPSASNKTIKMIFDLCKPFNLPIKTLPGLSDILHGNVSVSQIKPLSLEDLLQREPVKAEIASVRQYIEGKTVMVTGAGGSIGSELCRQIIKYKPNKLVMYERYENGLFQTDLELKVRAKNTQVCAVIGDILDRERLQEVFETFKPKIIFHAAAHKHVPLMEQNPLEAVKNNVFGTKNLIDASMRHGAEGFVMISTDKAVNPTNFMGATKRIAEFLTLNANSKSNTMFTTVRFGNVLGSNGSVVHIFRDQLKRGGPLTVTHPDIKRYFMLIPEAVQLVLVAASQGRGGEIFVLDMGEPIRITEFAENLIRLSGLVPHEDIKIEFTGLRPGEKLYEELFDASEEIVRTDIEKLRIARPKPPTEDKLMSVVDSLRQHTAGNSIDGIVKVIGEIVPGFKA